MTPQEKAVQLLQDINPYADCDIRETFHVRLQQRRESARACALVLVEEMIKVLQPQETAARGVELQPTSKDYWMEVKKEIQNFK